MKKICYVSCLYDLYESHTNQKIRTLLQNNIPISIISPGNIPDEFKNSLITFYKLNSISHSFDYNSSFFNIILAIFQRLINSIKAMYYLIIIKPGVCITTQPDSWALVIFLKPFFKYYVIEDLREIYEDRSAAFKPYIKSIVKKSIRNLLIMLSNNTDEILHVSNARRDYYSYLNKKGNVVSLYPNISEYISNNKLVQDSKALSDKTILVHAGSLRWSYAGEEIISAIYDIKDKFNFKLIIIGGISKDIKNVKQLNELIILGVIEVIPRIPHNQVIKILQSADIGINLVLPIDPTHKLAAPRKLYEYMAAGLAILGANVETIEEVLNNYEIGIIVDPQNPNSISDGIIELITNKSLITKYKRNSKTWSDMKFNWASESRKYLEIIEYYSR